MDILVKGYYYNNSFEIVYDTTDGFEVLMEQCKSACSLFHDLECDLIMLDAFGRVINNEEEVDDIRRVLLREVSSNLSLDGLVGPSNNTSTDSTSNDDDETWEQFSNHSESSGLMRATTVLNVWFIEANFLSNFSCCYDNLFTELCNENMLLWSKYRIIDTDMILCGFCKNLMDSSLIVSHNENFTTTSCNGTKILDIGLAVNPLNEETNDTKLNHEKYKKKFEVALSCQPLNLYIKRKLFEYACNEQILTNSSNLTLQQESIIKFQKRIENGCKQVMVYEDFAQQEYARQVIDYDKIRKYSIINMEREKNEDTAFLMGLMQWFKEDFFSWCNAPSCCNTLCNAPSSAMKAVNTTSPSIEESNYGWAGRTEIYICNQCQQTTRFPRYNNPSKLLETRRGRCGEWANAFCLICRSLGLDARWVLDFTDHVWVEVWSSSARRYLHLDPCERKIDTPLLYEGGWGKKLSYILSFSRHGVCDVTSRYTRNMEKVIERRTDIPENTLDTILITADNLQETEFRRNYNHATKNKNSTSRSTLYLDALLDGKERFEILANNDVSFIVMERRKRQNCRELLAYSFMKMHEWKLDELEGRISGDFNYKKQRGELGKDKNIQLRK